VADATLKEVYGDAFSEDARLVWSDGPALLFTIQSAQFRPRFASYEFKVDSFDQFMNVVLILGLIWLEVDVFVLNFPSLPHHIVCQNPLHQADCLARILVIKSLVDLSFNVES